MVNPAAPCYCEPVDRSIDPCGHGDTSEGCPKHDQRMLVRSYYCNNCRAVSGVEERFRAGAGLVWCEAVDASDPSSTEWCCLNCGDYVLCDECGAEFTESHAETHEVA